MKEEWEENKVGGRKGGQKWMKIREGKEGEA